jgi:hypothetical protein
MVPAAAGNIYIPHSGAKLKSASQISAQSVKKMSMSRKCGIVTISLRGRRLEKLKKFRQYGGDGGYQ